MTLLGKIVTCVFVFLFALMLYIQSEKPVMVPIDETTQEAMPEQVYQAFQESLNISQTDADTKENPFMK